MGYDIVGQTSAKDYDLYGYDKSVITHIQCPYTWQPKFRNAIGCEITSYKGRLTKNNYMDFACALDKIIDMLESGASIIQYAGNLSNRSSSELLNDFKELRDGVLERKIRYVDIS